MPRAKSAGGAFDCPWMMDLAKDERNAIQIEVLDSKFPNRIWNYL